MPSGASSGRSKREQRVKSLLSFAADLQRQIPEAPNDIGSKKLLRDIEKQVATFPDNIGNLPVTTCSEIDAVATTLWNLCTRSARNIREIGQHGAEQYNIFDDTILLAKTFSFLLLDCTKHHNQCKTSDIARLMKVALRTAKTSLNHQRYDVALRVMEKASIYEEMLRPEKQSSPEEGAIYARMIADYFILRTSLAWRQDKFDIAEHMFRKVEASDPITTENLADTLYELGKDLLMKKQYEMAVKWLERASETLASQELDKLSTEASELRISILQCTVEALLKLQNEETLEKARNIVALLVSELGDKLVVLLLKLEILDSSVNEDFDGNAYYDVVHRIIRSVTLSKENYKLVMKHIRKLHNKSPSLACSAINEFLLDRILDEANIEWTERVVVSRVLMVAGHSQDNHEVLQELHNILEQTALRSKGPFSLTATHAVQMLLWKQIESCVAQHQYETAQSWCHLALHRLFEGAGEANISKIIRKLLICAIARQDIVSANEIFSSMPKVHQDAPLTRFLMFKIAIRAQQSELAAECLEKLLANTGSDSSLLFACVMDAQQVGDTSQIIAALQLVLHKSELHSHDDVHIPSLLRCTLRLMFSQLETKDQSIDVSIAVGEICRLLEAAVLQAQRSSESSSSPKLFTVDELTWFAKSSYHLAMKYSSEWTPHEVLRITRCCKILITTIPRDISQDLAADLDLRLMSCDFLASLLLVALARVEDNIEVQLDNYLNLQHHVEDFDKKLEQSLDKLEDVVKHDLLDKLGVLIAWDFEAAAQLKQWDRLKEIVLKAGICKRLRTYETMMDCILVSKASTPVKILTMKSIVNEVWGLDALGTTTLSRYLRIFFQLSVNEHDAIAEELLDQVATLAHEAGEGAQIYPAEELEWIATVAFNRAVDFFVAEDDETCKRWAEKALNIAACCMDNGSLQNALQEKFMGLKFDS